ncbi:MAG: c-type cytochrome [Gemmatimonadales bacterium]
MTPIRWALGLAVLFAFPSPSPAVAQGAGAQSAAGAQLFETRCAACHSPGTDRIIGPGLAGINERRDRAWLTAFITAPDRLLAEGDSIANALLAEYTVPMPNLGVSPAEAAAILDYLAGGGAAAAAAPVPVVQGDPAAGRLLFTGERRLEQGGAACISCHTVSGLGGLGGGTLGKDLTQAASSYGDGLRLVIANSPFPAMQSVFGPRPLTTQEVGDLTAFLNEIGQEGGAAATSLPFFVFVGLAGMALLTVFGGVIWRRRLGEVRRPLIGGTE